MSPATVEIGSLILNAVTGTQTVSKVFNVERLIPNAVVKEVERLRKSDRASWAALAERRIARLQQELSATRVDIQDGDPSVGTIADLPVGKRPKWSGFRRRRERYSDSSVDKSILIHALMLAKRGQPVIVATEDQGIIDDAKRLAREHPCLSCGDNLTDWLRSLIPDAGNVFLQAHGVIEW
jgi:hypothetical protein